MVTFTPDGLPPGVTSVPDDTDVAADVADWGYDRRAVSLLVVTEEGGLVVDGRVLGGHFTVADW